MNRKEKRSTLSHNAHELHHQENFLKGEDHLYVLRNKDCVAYKLLLRNLDILQPLLRERNKWLTIGDFTGSEAHFLGENN